MSLLLSSEQAPGSGPLSPTGSEAPASPSRSSPAAPRSSKRSSSSWPPRASKGITAKAYTADVRSRQAPASALDSAAEDLGPVEVLQFSPVSSAEFLKPVLDTTVEDLQAAAELSVLGSATAIRQVLPGMIEPGTGTVLLINGADAATPNGSVAGTSTAFAGESAYGAMLHEAVSEKGVNVRRLIIPGAIGGGDPLYDPVALSERIWQLHAEPEGPFRVTVGGEQT